MLCGFLVLFSQVESCKIGTNKSVSGSAVFAVVTLENVVESHKLCRVLQDEPFRGTILTVKKVSYVKFFFKFLASCDYFQIYKFCQYDLKAGFVQV